MPIVNGEEILEITANQLDEFVFNTQFGSVNYSALQPTTTYLFTNQSLAASNSITNTTGVQTGNNAKMQVSFSQHGSSTNCTMILYGSDSEDLSIPHVITILTIGSNDSTGAFIEPAAIPAYTYAKLINNDSSFTAIGTVRIITWQEPA